MPQVLSFFLWGIFLSFFSFDFDRMRKRREEEEADRIGAKGRQKQGKLKIRLACQALIDDQLTRPSYYRGTIILVPSLHQLRLIFFWCNYHHTFLYFMMCLPACLLVYSLSGCTFLGTVPYHGDSPHQVCQKVAAARCRTKPADPVLPGKLVYSQFPDVCKMDCHCISPKVRGQANPGPVCNTIAVRFTNVRKLPVLAIPVSPSLPPSAVPYSFYRKVGFSTS